MSDDTDTIVDMGPSPAPLLADAGMPDLIRVVNQLQSAEYTNRVSRHKHRSQVNRVVDEVRDELTDAVAKLTTSNKRIELGLFGDEFGNKGMVHRLEALELAAKPSAAPTVTIPVEPTLADKAKVMATEWAIKIGVLIAILVLLDYGSKAVGLWKSGVAP